MSISLDKCYHFTISLHVCCGSAWEHKDESELCFNVARSCVNATAASIGISQTIGGIDWVMMCGSFFEAKSIKIKRANVGPM